MERAGNPMDDVVRAYSAAGHGDVVLSQNPIDKLSGLLSWLLLRSGLAGVSRTQYPEKFPDSSLFGTMPYGPDRIVNPKPQTFDEYRKTLPSVRGFYPNEIPRSRYFVPEDLPAFSLPPPTHQL